MHHKRDIKLRSEAAVKPKVEAARMIHRFAQLGGVKYVESNFSKSSFTNSTFPNDPESRKKVIFCLSF